MLSARNHARSEIRRPKAHKRLLLLSVVGFDQSTATEACSEAEWKLPSKAMNAAN
jgi:hypothetical protein